MTSLAINSPDFLPVGYLAEEKQQLLEMLLIKLNAAVTPLCRYSLKYNRI